MINSNVSSWLRVSSLVGLAALMMAARTGAQTFSLSVTNPPGPVPASNALTYTISVTNIANIPLGSNLTPTQPALLTNSFSGPVQWQSATILRGLFPANVIFSNSTRVVFDLGYLITDDNAVVTVTVLPTAPGTVTNTITASAPNYNPGGGITNYAITNIITAITNALGPTNVSADLAISLSGPLSSVITNDWMTYDIAITNLGTNDASNVILSNMLPAGVRYISVWPPALSPTEADSNVVFNLGTVTNGAVTYLALRVQPTNAGTLTFSSVVGSQDVPDPNPTNNASSTNIVVTNFLSGQLTVSLVDATQQFNPQTGLLEQRIRLSNADTNPISFARVTVIGLTNWMFNAAGTNNGNPFVVYANTLNTNESVDLLLEYFNPFGLPAPFASLQPNQVPFISLAPPALNLLGTLVGVSNVIQFANGDVMLEFPSFTNRSYTVIYFDNGISTNPMVALPSYLSPANWVQWIDYGPPKTIVHPTNTITRTYSVFMNP